MSVAPPTDLAPRFASLEPTAFAIPNGREEEWRFVPMDRAGKFFDSDRVAGTLEAAPAPYVSTAPIEDISDGWVPTDRAAAVARAGVDTAIVVDIPADDRPSEPIVVRLIGPQSMNFGHISIRAGAHSEATIIVVHDLSVDVSGTIVTRIGDGAKVTIVQLLEGGQGQQMLHWHTSVGRDATFLAATVVLDGSFVRFTPTIQYDGPGGSADVLGVFLADRDNFFEQRILVEHEAPHCRSNVVYKGALSGDRAHTVWVGDVLVRRTAVGTDTYEMNRNLLLEDGPRADSVPNLELETGDVASAGHASATGRFDDMQLFYLMSRGLTEQQARQMVVRGFFAEVIRMIPSTDWRDRLFTLVDRRLGIAGGEHE